ncbi:MAG: ParB/RepB/Spo0J family partition protein [Undibacterium umbellatum]|uniref:ParB/RepB/Spo0J family partition protein n=1 Tax=Undibacterium umbellatum TaxID=2762300 RepID=UPI003BB491BF
MSLTESAAVATTEQPIVASELVDQGAFGIYSLRDIRISKTNRKRFNEQALQELAADIKVYGVAQPILIRPVTPSDEEPEPYEIVAGERRYRASKLAGAVSIPAMLRVLSDSQAAKMQLLENLQREDPHPLEEAIGYENLMMAHGYSADQLVTELKKTRSYVYGRLKLCSLAADLREDFLDNKFPASIALILARIPVPALQRQAADEILGETEEDQLSVRDATAHLHKRFTLKLDDAPFKTSDSKLLPDVGSCAKCPKRTGNQPEIFADAHPNYCTDPNCFEEKTAAAFNQKVFDIVKSGIPVLSEFEEGDNELSNARSAKSDTATEATQLWHMARRKPSTLGMTTIGHALLGKTQPTPVLKYIRTANNRLVPIWNIHDAQEALEKAGYCYTLLEIATKPSVSDTSTATARTVTSGNGTVLTQKNNDAYLEKIKQEDERIERAAKETTYRVELYKRLRQRGFNGFSLPSLRAFAKRMLIDANDYELNDDVFKYLPGIYPFMEDYTRDKACEFIENAPLDVVQLVLVDLVLSDSLLVDQWGIETIGDGDDSFVTVEAMARAEGIEPDQVRAELEKPTEPEPQAEPAPKPSKRGRPAKTVEVKETTQASEEQATAPAEQPKTTKIKVARPKSKQAAVEPVVEDQATEPADLKQEPSKPSINASWPFPKSA